MDATQQDSTGTTRPCPRAKCTDFTIIPEHNTESDRPYGLPRKDGVELLPACMWTDIWAFIQSQSWYFEELPNREDGEDELLKQRLKYGAFMLGFDFHLTEQGPRLIEINTNAGGLATLFSLAPAADQQCLQGIFVSAVIAEYQAATSTRDRPSLVAIVDEHVQTQPMYSEMEFFAGLLKQNNVACVVVSPEDLKLGDIDNRLYFEGRRVDLVYNRLTDFRFVRPEHRHLRLSAVAQQVVITPHPAAYARIADKRNLIRLDHPVVPQTHLLGDKDIEYWSEMKKGYVFKPAEGNGSRGVYRGDKLSKTKLQELDPGTVVQQLCPPPESADKTKYDLRVFTSGTHLLGVATRHFTGQVMEMRSKQAGFRQCLPEGVASYTDLFVLTRCPGGSKCSYGQMPTEAGGAEAVGAGANNGCCYPSCQCPKDLLIKCSVAQCEEEQCEC